MVPSIDGLNGVRARDLSDAAYAYITVTCYHSAAANSICAGGGDFDRILYSATDPNCFQTSGLDNGATLIQDHVGNCFYRKNFGLNGVVDARQCGVYGDGLEHTPSDGALLYNCMQIAAQIVTPAPPNAVAVVNTGGGVILDNDTRLVVPFNIELNCGGGTQTSAGNNDFRNITLDTGPNLHSALVLSPNLQNTLDPVTRSPIELSDRSTLAGCLVEASGGTQNGDGSYPFPYAPSVWYPGCSEENTPVCPSGSPGNQPVYLRSAIEERDAFSAAEGQDCMGRPASCEIAITTGHLKTNDSNEEILSGGAGATVRDVTVVGFNTCVKSAARDLTVRDCRFDCATVFDLKTPDVPFISNVRSGRLLTEPQG